MSTGYEGAFEKDFGSVEYDLERWPTLYSERGHVCRLVRNGVPIGLIHVPPDEFEWLKERIKGTFIPEG